MEEELETNLESSTELSKVYVIWVAGLDGFKEVWSTWRGLCFVTVNKHGTREN